MSGWIKMGVHLRTHPKVVRMASALKADRLRVIGGLWAIWCIFDAHTDDGLLEGYTLDAIDVDLGWRGFGAAMQSIGWLEESESGLHAPDYEVHNGVTAKRRVTETARKAASREETGDVRTKAERMADGRKTESGQMSASDADTKRARGDKRREEQETEAIASAVAEKTPRPSRKCPEAFEPADAQAWIDEHAPGIDWKRETEKFRDHTFRSALTDWLGAWRNWMRRTAESAVKSSAPMSFRERDAANAAARIHEMTGGLVSAKPVSITRRNDALQEVFDATPRRLG